MLNEKEKIKKVRYDEDFFLKHSKEIQVDSNLPFKLQKRELLQKLGFPLDTSLLIPIKDHEKIPQILLKIKKEKPILIGIHLKPMPTYITPFFIFRNDKIEHRDEFGNIKIVTLEEMLKKIKDYFLYSQKSWIEITNLIWSPTTITGRIIYFSALEQLIEIQKGVMPDQLGNEKEKLPYFTTNLFLFQLPNDFARKISSSGFKKEEIEKVISSLRQHKRKFEALKRIANLPTLEFGYIEKRGLIVVDIDWPTQYTY
jgi:hypothetical protein